MTTADLGSATLSDFAAIVGARHTNPARTEDAVGGLVPHAIVEPGTLEEARQVLQLAGRAGVAVAPRGSGTKLGWGNPPKRLDLILSTLRLNHVLEHAAGDLVVRVEAGVKLAALQSELAKAGQRLALDPPEPDATIGGIVAANASGPLRHRFGTVRDLLLGITFVLADGTIAKAGGKVVKNVAGYDLAKLFTGSFGTLGLIVEAIFRLHPLPAAREAVIVRVRDPQDVLAAVHAIFNTFLTPSALEFSSVSGERMVIAVFEGVPESVEAQCNDASLMLKPFGEASRTASEATILAPPETGEGCLSLNVRDRTSNLSTVLEEIEDLSRRLDLSPLVSGHAGIGITHVSLAGGAEDVQTRFVRSLREKTESRGGSVQIREASLPLIEAVEVWGSPGDALPLMRRVKERFDPSRTMNPGRFVGGL